LIIRRVQRDDHEPTTDLDSSPRIHLQEFDRGSSSRRPAFDSSGIVFNPPEVILPALSPWIEKRNRTTCLRVGTDGELPLSSVTEMPIVLHAKITDIDPIWMVR